MSGRPPSSMGSGVLSLEEKKFLLAVERGDVASTRRLSINTSENILIALPHNLCRSPVFSLFISSPSIYLAIILFICL